jgi:uncharacterized protein YciU (UPF0263 family)
MNSRQFQELQEAYSNVYSPKENIEEGLRSAVKRLLGGNKKEAEAPKPQSRGDQLRARYNVGPEGSDTSAKRKILNRAKGNAERAQNQVDMGNASQSYANTAKDAHNKYLKAGYSKYGADAPYQGRGNKARKRSAALNVEDFEFIVNSLIEEGHDLSPYTWDEMYDICLDEANEKVDIYDVILSHLIDEGYASTEEAATAIMVNMSEEWRDSVVEAYKDLPADKMIRKAGVKQFKHGMSVGSGASSNPKVAQQVGKMSAVALLHDPERAKAKSKMKKD